MREGNGSVARIAHCRGTRNPYRTHRTVVPQQAGLARAPQRELRAGPSLLSSTHKRRRWRQRHRISLRRALKGRAIEKAPPRRIGHNPGEAPPSSRSQRERRCSQHSAVIPAGVGTGVGQRSVRVPAAASPSAARSPRSSPPKLAGRSRSFSLSPHHPRRYADHAVVSSGRACGVNGSALFGLADCSPSGVLPPVPRPGFPISSRAGRFFSLLASLLCHRQPRQAENGGPCFL